MIEPDAWSHDNHSFLPVVEPMQSSGTNQQLLIRDLTFKFSSHSSRVQGRFLNTPLFQSLDGWFHDSTRLWGSFPALLLSKLFISSRSPFKRAFQSLYWFCSCVTGRESLKAGPGHSPLSNLSHQDSITLNL